MRGSNVTSNTVTQYVHTRHFGSCIVRCPFFIMSTNRVPLGIYISMAYSPVLLNRP